MAPHAAIFSKKQRGTKRNKEEQKWSENKTKQKWNENQTKTKQNQIENSTKQKHLNSNRIQMTRIYSNRSALVGHSFISNGSCRFGTNFEIQRLQFEIKERCRPALTSVPIWSFQWPKQIRNRTKTKSFKWKSNENENETKIKRKPNTNQRPIANPLNAQWSLWSVSAI